MAVRAVLLAAVVAALAGCGGGGEAHRAGAGPAADVRELRTVADLRAAFEADRRRARLVLLLSPT